MKTSEQTNELFAALAKAQSVMKPAAKNARNPHLKNKFADLASCMEAISGPLSANGLAIMQGCRSRAKDQGGESWEMVTRLGHTSGQWVEATVPMVVNVSKGLNPMQAFGVAMTYSRRYGLALVGLVSDEDTDGSGAGDHPSPSRPKAAPNLSEYEACGINGAPLKPTTRQQGTGNTITEGQQKRLFAIAREKGFSKEGIKALLASCNYASSADILMDDYDDVIARIENATP